MPILELPDVEKHRLCIRCRKWHHPEEGTLVVPEGLPGGWEGAVSAAAMLASGLSSDRQRPRFLCHACRKVRLVRRAVLTVIFAALIGAALLLRP